MSKIRKFRIVTNGERFCVQEQKKVLFIRWWKFSEPYILFTSFSSADNFVKNRENADRSLEEIKLDKKEELKGMKKSLWKLVKEEN